MAQNPFVFQVGDLYRMIRQTFESEDGIGVPRAQAKLLLSVWRSPGITQQALATRLDIATMSVCRQVDALEARGMLERRVDPADRRVRRLYITEKTGPIITPLLARIDEISDLLLSALSLEEQATFRGLLDRIIADTCAKKTETTK